MDQGTLIREINRSENIDREKQRKGANPTYPFFRYA